MELVERATAVSVKRNGRLAGNIYYRGYISSWNTGENVSSAKSVDAVDFQPAGTKVWDDQDDVLRLPKDPEKALKGADWAQFKVHLSPQCENMYVKNLTSDDLSSASRCCDLK